MIEQSGVVAGVVDVGEIAGQAEADRRQDEHRLPEGARAHAGLSPSQSELALQQLFDGCFVGRGFGERARFELLQRTAGLAEFEGRRAGEAGLVGGLRVGGDLVGVRRFAARGGPVGEVQAGDLRGETLDVAFVT